MAARRGVRSPLTEGAGIAPPRSISIGVEASIVDAILSCEVRILIRPWWAAGEHTETAHNGEFPKLHPLRRGAQLPVLTGLSRSGRLADGCGQLPARPSAPLGSEQRRSGL